MNERSRTSQTHDTKVRTITTDELAEQIRRGDPVQIVNVLSPSSYHLGMIPGSKKIPLAELEQRLGELDVRQEVVTYCAGFQCHASREAAQVLASRGFRVRAYEGGIDEWKRDGQPAESGESAMAPPGSSSSA